MNEFDPETITRNYTYALLEQCDQIESNLLESGLDPNSTKLVSLQAAYNFFKHLLGTINDKECQEEMYKIIEFDAKSIMDFHNKPNVTYVGNA